MGAAAYGEKGEVARDTAPSKCGKKTNAPWCGQEYVRALIPVVVEPLSRPPFPSFPAAAMEAPKSQSPVSPGGGKRPMGLKISIPQDAPQPAAAAAAAGQLPSNFRIQVHKVSVCGGGMQQSACVGGGRGTQQGETKQTTGEGSICRLTAKR